jgi:hypothetical protein
MGDEEEIFVGPSHTTGIIPHGSQLVLTNRRLVLRLRRRPEIVIFDIPLTEIVYITQLSRTPRNIFLIFLFIVGIGFWPLLILDIVLIVRGRRRGGGKQGKLRFDLKGTKTQTIVVWNRQRWVDLINERRALSQ